MIFVTVAYRLGPLGFLHLSHLADGKDYPDAQIEVMDSTLVTAVQGLMVMEAAKMR